jgi:hypothetical protein
MVGGGNEARNHDVLEVEARVLHASVTGYPSTREYPG